MSDDLDGISGCIGFPGYLIQRDGSIYSTIFRNRNCDRKRKVLLKMSVYLGSEGYPVVCLTKNGKQVKRTVHSLLMESFCGPKPAGMIVRHKNGNREDCRLENLAWATPRENYDDMFIHGTTTKGERNGSSKLTNEQVAEIKKSPLGSTTLGRKYGVHRNCILLIKSNQRWTHI